jgi:hypothetical protein
VNIDDRGRAAAGDLTRKANMANMPPPPPKESFPASRVWAFAIGAAVVAAIVFLPLMLLGGPRDSDEPVSPVTTAPTSTTTEPLQTTTTETRTGEPETTTTTPFADLNAIDDLAAVVPEAPTPDVVATLGWGDGDGQLGLDEKGVGPAGFDVASDGTIVVLDRAKLRLVAVGSGDGSVHTLAQWDAGDFVPDAMVIASRDRNDVVFVLGMTNRPGRPHDLISMRLDGTIIERGETIVPSSTELVVSAGAVFGREPPVGARVRWYPLATDAGDVLDREDQAVRYSLFLNDGGGLVLQYPPQDTGVTVVRTDRDGNELVRWQVDLGGASWGHEVLPLGDSILVTAYTTEIEVDGSTGRIAAVIDARGQVTEGFSWGASRWAEIGPFGITRFGPDGAIYDMYSTEDGVQIRRYPMSAAADFDALSARAGYGRAMAVDGEYLWIAGPQRVSSDRGEWAEILQANVPTQRLTGVWDLTMDMHAIDAADGTVWMARAGDGALPDSLVGRLDVATGDLEVTDVGDLSPRDIVATETGAWLVSWNGGSESELAFVDGATMRVGSRITMPEGAGPQAVALHDGVLWVGSWDGLVYRFDTNSWQFLDAYDTSLAIVDILVEEDRFGSDLAVWVLGDGGGVRKLRADGTVVVTVSLPGFGRALAAGGTMGTVWAVTATGKVYLVGDDGEPYLVAETGVPGVTDMVFDGGHLWILGETLVTVSMGG